MTNPYKFRLLIFKNAPGVALMTAGIVGAFCVPNDAVAQDRYSNTITCSSNGRRVTCDADTGGGVRLVRQLSGARCREGSTWGYDSRAIWVDRGCRAEFEVSGADSHGGYVRESSRTVTCASQNGRRVNCSANTQGGVRMVRQLSGSPCREGSTWGYDSRGIWVDRGCRAEFDVSRADSGGYVSGAGSQRPFRDIIGVGTNISVRTNERIDARNSDGRVFSGVVDQDVRDESGNVAIPRGSDAELIVRNAGNNDLVLDLESVAVNGQRYALTAGVDRISGGRRDGIGKNTRTGEFVGGGAVVGAIIGAIAGGGRGAAIGAAAGAGAGAGGQVLTRGSSVAIPAESLLTFRLDQPLELGPADNGFTRDGRHYHQPNR